MAHLARTNRLNPVRLSLLTLTGVFLATGHALAQASNVVVLDRDGRTLAAPPSWHEDRPVTITFRDPRIAGDVKDSDEQKKKTAEICENLRVSYVWHSKLLEPQPLFSDQSAVYGKIRTETLSGCGQRATKEPKVEIPRVSPGSNVLTYTVWEMVKPDRELNASTLQSIDATLAKLNLVFNNGAATTLTSGAVSDLSKNVELVAAVLDYLADRRAGPIAVATRTLKGLEEDAKLFAGTSDAVGVQRLSAMVDDVRIVRKELQEHQDTRARNQQTAKALRDLAPRILSLKAALEATKCGFAKVLKVGGVVAGARSRSTYYNFAKSPAPPGVALVLMGSYPRLTQDDRLFAVVANRSLGEHQYPFALSATKVVSAPPNLAPVRPTFDVTKAIASGTERGGPISLFSLEKTKGKGGEAIEIECPVTVDKASLDTAFRDSILPFQERFVGNEILTVSIATYIPQVTTDKQTTSVDGGETKVSKQTVIEAKVVDVLSEVKYPQVRALYRFNFATGVVFGTKKPPSFVTVKSAADDVTTAAPANEARYQLEKGEGPAPVFGAFLFSTYLKRVDIQDPVWRRCGRLRCPGWRMLPAPAVGFSITSPTENVFLGATMEIMENVHAFVGGHNGKMAELVVPRDAEGNPITVPRADHDAADPKTRDRREWNWSYGVTFNINILAGYFK